MRTIHAFPCINIYPFIRSETFSFSVTLHRDHLRPRAIIGLRRDGIDREEEFVKKERREERERERERERSNADATDTVTRVCNKVNKEPVRQVDSAFGPTALLFPSAGSLVAARPRGKKEGGREEEERGEQGAPWDQFRALTIGPRPSLCTIILDIVR